MFRSKIPLDELETKLKAAFAARYRPYAGALVSFAYTPGTDRETALVSCRWVFLDEPQQPRATVTYPVLTLEERWLPMEIAPSELLEVLGGKGTLGSCMLGEPVTEVEELDTFKEPFTGWRESAFEATLRHGASSFDRTAVVAKGLRPHPSVAHAAHEWVWQRRSHPNSYLSAFDLAKLRILIPDTRARIRRANWVGGTLTLLNDRNAAPEDVELQGLIVERTESVMLDAGAVEPEVTWEVPSDADVVEVYLIHRDGTLLSHRRLKRGEHHSARPGEFVLQERAERELRQGEGERVEYKPFIDAKTTKIGRAHV